MVSIAQAHPFVQGNKRTGFVSGRNFMQNHGYDIDLPDSEAFAEFLVGVVQGYLTEADLHTLIAPYVVDADPAP